MIRLILSFGVYHVTFCVGHFWEPTTQHKAAYQHLSASGNLHLTLSCWPSYFPSFPVLGVGLERGGSKSVESHLDLDLDPAMTTPWKVWYSLNCCRCCLLLSFWLLPPAARDGWGGENVLSFSPHSHAPSDNQVTTSSLWSCWRSSLKHILMTLCIRAYIDSRLRDW